MDPQETHWVKQTLRAWKAGLSDIEELTTVGPTEPVGEPILIERFEEIQVLRRTSVSGETMALISWRDTVLLVIDQDLETRTIRVFRSLQ